MLSIGTTHHVLIFLVLVDVRTALTCLPIPRATICRLTDAIVRAAYKRLTCSNGPKVRTWSCRLHRRTTRRRSSVNEAATPDELGKRKVLKVIRSASATAWTSSAANLKDTARDKDERLAIRDEQRVRLPSSAVMSQCVGLGCSVDVIHAGYRLNWIHRTPTFGSRVAA